MDSSKSASERYAKDLLFTDGMPIIGTAVSMGNPHFISFLDTPVGSVELDRVGHKVEHHPAFPNRVNFSR